MTCASFPQFTKLPHEIQAAILSLVLDIDAPRAYITEMTANPIGVDTRGCTTYKWGLRRVRLRHSLPPAWSPTPEVLFRASAWALMQVSFFFRQFTIRKWKNWRPAEPFSLEDCGRQQPYYLKWKQSPGNPRLIVDGAQDLMIINRENGIPYDTMDDTRVPIRLLAIYWRRPEERESPRPRPTLHAIARMFPQLRVLYILMDPHTMMQYRNGTQLDWETANLTPEEARDNGSSRTFHLKDRIYYEVPPSEVAKLGGLQDIIADKLKDERRSLRITHLPIRIMSWRCTTT